MGNMEIWYSHLSGQNLMNAISAAAGQVKTKNEAGQAKPSDKVARLAAAKAHTRTSSQGLPKLGKGEDRRHRFVRQPPVAVSARHVESRHGYSTEQHRDLTYQEFRACRMTLQNDRQHLLEPFDIAQMTRKEVRVGSAGNRRTRTPSRPDCTSSKSPAIAALLPRRKAAAIRWRTGRTETNGPVDHLRTNLQSQNSQVEREAG
jgi:Uncharacterized protein conserved in bacteria (DUF2252)